MVNYYWRRQVRGPVLLATAATVALLTLTGCGGGAEEPNVASANPSGATATTGVPPSDAVVKYVESKRQWVKCLREQGFDLPDPDARGHVEISGEQNKKLKADRKWLEAQKKCQEFQLPVPAELEEKEEPATPEQIEHRREYAKCIRANGASDWPDPNANGEWPNWSGSRADDATVNRALQICDPVLDGKAPTTPDPSRTFQG
jgi:hypothetical protein